ncbi:MAG: DUF3108 domain-containing protein [Rhodospirillales bacterium]|nr:DUF3108 domain-containing protein [Rhodospirillales bacterium]
MRHVVALAVLLIPSLAPLAARPEPPPVALRLTYVTYADGFTTVRVGATLDLTPRGYKLSLDYRTVGMVGFLFPGHDSASADGVWHDSRAYPLIFQSQGLWSGHRYTVLMDYADGAPEVRRLIPSQRTRRAAVPASLEKGTTDTLSAMALLLHQVAMHRTCRLAVRVFDGRRLIALAARPAGIDTLGVTTRSFFHGPALRCDLSGRLLAGYLLSDSPAERRRVHHGTVWFAHPVQGLPLLPVRMAFDTHWFGTATMYLTDIRAAPVVPLTARSRVALAPVKQTSQGTNTTR